jgi:hypothetical protein
MQTFTLGFCSFRVSRIKGRKSPIYTLRGQAVHARVTVEDQKVKYEASRPPAMAGAD